MQRPVILHGVHAACPDVVVDPSWECSHRQQQLSYSDERTSPQEYFDVPPQEAEAAVEGQ